MDFTASIGGSHRQSQILDLVKPEDRFSKLQDLVYCDLKGDSTEELNRMSNSQLAHLANKEVENMVRKKENMQKKKLIDLYYSMVEKDFLSDIGAGSTLTCWKCGGGNIEINVKQTRSADEGSTAFCMCPTCKTRWKMS